MASISDRVTQDNQSNTVVLIGFIVLVILFALIWSIFHFVYESTDNVFYGMLSNSLSTTSFTKRIVQGSSQDLVAQTIYVETGAKNIALSKELRFVASGIGKVETLNIGTPTTDYSKITLLQTDQRNSQGTLLNYSPVVNVWAINKPGSAGQTSGQLFTSALLGSIVPIGNVTPVQKSSLMNYIKTQKVYLLGKVTKASVAGRTQYTYVVGVNLPAFATMLNQFGTDLGMKLPPTNTKPLEHEIETADITIDALSRQLIDVRYIDTQTAEVFSSFNVKKAVSLPKAKESLSSLETEISKIGSN